MEFLPDGHSGSKLGKYEILSRLSMGGMAEIFLAFHRSVGGFQKPVVIKRILPEHREDPTSIRLLLEEARLCATLNHPSIGQVHDVEQVGDDILLVMEFIPGATLFELADEAQKRSGEPLPVGFTLAAIREAGLALHHAHSHLAPSGQAQPVVHRDVTPRNIMVTYDGVTKLLDFGIARPVGAARMTMAGMVRGTSAYMSPEQTSGQALDPRSDQFSLGIVAHELLAGRRLFARANPVEEMLAVQDADIPAPSTHNPLVPAEVDAVVLRALDRRVDRRYASVLEFVRELGNAVEPSAIWAQDHSGLLVRQLFGERQQRTRQLLRTASEQAAGPSAPNPVSGAGERSERAKPRSIPPAAPAAPAASTLPDAAVASTLPNRAAFDGDATLLDDRAGGMALGNQATLIREPSAPQQTVLSHDLPPPPRRPAGAPSSGGARATRSPTRGAAPKGGLLKLLGGKIWIGFALAVAMGIGVGAAAHWLVRNRGEKTAPVAVGRLSIGGDVPADIFLEGRRLGRIPLVDLYIQSGKYTFRLVSPEGERRLLPVTVKPTGVTKVEIAFEKLALEP